MNPRAVPRREDLELAREVAARIVAAGEGGVCRVVMIGSRALGTARPDSDLDLVVLVEPLGGGPPWRSADFAAARRRLREKVGRTPLPTDLWVRTTDRFEEARGVVGGVEWLAEREGVEVYARAPKRPPQVRLPRDQIRRQNVSAWIEHALLALETAAAAGGAVPGGGGVAGAGNGTSVVLERTVNAVLVAHQVYAAKNEGAAGMLARLDGVDAPLAREIRARLGAGPVTLVAARAVLGLAVRRLAEDRELARYLAGPIERLARPMIVPGG